MRIFITGASGFIGGAIARSFVADHEVIAMARSKEAEKKVLRYGAKALLCDLDSVEPDQLRGIDVLIHCAALVEPWGTRQQFWETNVEGTRKLISTAKTAGIRRFIHMSTESCLFCGQDMIDIDESYPYPSHSPYLYSETKKEAEKIVLKANLPGHFETIALRPRLVWGPGDQTMLPNLIEMVKDGRFKWIDGGKAKTSSTHIDNLVYACKLSLTKGKGGEAYFITDDEVHTFREFLTLWLETAGLSPGSTSVPSLLLRPAAWLIECTWRILGISRKPPVTRFSAAIMSAHCTLKTGKAKEGLGYAPVISVATGMKKLKNFKNNV